MTENLFNMANTNSNRFVIEDSIPKATMDGESHEMMTLVAGLSGLLAAIVVLGILMTLIGCREQQDRAQNQQSSQSNSNTPVQKTSSLLPIFIQPDAINGNPQFVSIAVIPNDQGVANEAFVQSEINLQHSQMDRQGPEIVTERF